MFSRLQSWLCCCIPFIFHEYNAWCKTTLCWLLFEYISVPSNTCNFTCCGNMACRFLCCVQATAPHFQIVEWLASLASAVNSNIPAGCLVESFTVWPSARSHHIDISMGQHGNCSTAKKIISVLPKNYFVYSNPSLFASDLGYIEDYSDTWSVWELLAQNFHIFDCSDHNFICHHVIIFTDCVQMLCTCSMTDSHKSMKAYWSC